MSTDTTPQIEAPKIDLANLPAWLAQVDPFTFAVTLEHEGGQKVLHAIDPPRSEIHKMARALKTKDCEADFGLSECANLRAYLRDPDGKMLPSTEESLDAWKVAIGRIRNSQMDRIWKAVAALQESLKEGKAGN